MTNPSNEPITNQSINETEDFIDWGIIFQTLYDSMFRILGATMAAFILGLIFAANIKDVYTATVRLHVEMMSNYSDVVYKGSSGEKTDSDRITYYGTQLEVMQSDPIYEETIKTMNLPHRLGLSIDECKGILKKNVDVELVHGTEIINITVSNHDPFLAADIANTLARVYISWSYKNRLRTPKELEKIFSKIGNNSSYDEFLTKPNPSLDETLIESLPAVSEDQFLASLKQSLLDTQNQIEVLSNRYTPNHPDILDLKEKEQSLKNQINIQMNHLISGIRSVLKGYLNANNVTIIQSAVPPSMEFWSTKRVHITFLLTFTGFMTSIFFVIFFSYVHRKIERAEDLKRIPDVAFLGYVPEIPVPKKEKGNARKFLLTQMNLNPQLRDCIHEIRNNLLFSMPKGKNKTLLCCSLLPDEGKSVVTCMLATSLASVGEKVLIIDADMRDPSIHLSFGQENTFGFSNCLVEMNSWKYLLRTVDELPNLKVLCAGSTAPNSASLLSTPQLLKIINEMKEEFGFIIFDAPPLLQIPDAFIISEKTDGMLFIIKAGSVEIGVVEKIKNKIRSLNINLVGLVINKVNLKRVYKGYYQSFYGAYGKKKKK